MQFKKQLLLWLMRPLWLMIACTWVGWGGWTLFTRTPLFVEWFSAFIFVLCNSLMIVLWIMPFQRHVSVLYTGRYDRRTIWSHVMLAGAVAVLLECLGVALLVWTPLRSMVQVTFWGSPFYPYVAVREWIVPIYWLLGYGLFVPVLYYAFARAAYPARGAMGGFWLAGVLVLAAFAILLEDSLYPAWSWTYAALWGALLCAGVAMLAGAYWMRHRVEVRP